MGQSSAQYHQFFIEIKKSEKIWTLRDEGGFPSPISVSGNRVMLLKDGFNL
ncbi:PF11042 domain protein [Leptospira interrogans serovar Lora str. TE 1992]|uniref:PF11042 domain protein n=1 Tax=Leptospira interrogans serovar Lora str. TE 1992 TaxID=1193028 RepID=M3EUS2_LEPIR|nr:PF11042 domain protein [Leptospira interrogans serovar Lora str. TE 1992]EMN09187.1 PF11042 domain protein [Leptospira interrogans serovar Muenchen str. Brem 129]